MNSRKLKAVSNSGPLIHLAKIGALWLLDALFDEILIPIEVKREAVDAGIELGHDDARIIREFIKRGKIRVTKYEVTNLSPAKRYGIDEGEYSAIILAIKENCIFLCDDERARELAEREGLEVMGSIGVVLMALQNNLIDKKQAKTYIENLKKAMYFSKDLFQRVEKILENM